MKDNNGNPVLGFLTGSRAKSEEDIEDDDTEPLVRRFDPAPSLPTSVMVEEVEDESPQKQRQSWPMVAIVLSYFLVASVIIAPSVLRSETSTESVMDEEPLKLRVEPESVLAVDPEGCTFINGNRPMVGNKFILTCTQGTFLATGEYDYAILNFRWWDYETYNPPP